MIRYRCPSCAHKIRVRDARPAPRPAPFRDERRFHCPECDAVLRWRRLPLIAEIGLFAAFPLAIIPLALTGARGFLELAEPSIPNATIPPTSSEP